MTTTVEQSQYAKEGNLMCAAMAAMLHEAKKQHKKY